MREGNDYQLQLAYANCLGICCAIDPSRLEIFLHQSSLPVTHDSYDLAFDLIQNHLSKSLGTGTSKIEAEIGYSIQNLLHFTPKNGVSVKEKIWSKFSEDVIFLYFYIF